VAGVLALLGAALTVSFIHRQIKHAADFEKDRHIREERAARILLPMALSAIAQYAIDCIKLLEPYGPVVGKGPQVQPGMAAPRIPDGILEPMQASARYADGTIADEIGGTVAWLQAQHARLEGFNAQLAVRAKISGTSKLCGIMDAAELHARCGKLFPYSRRSTPDPNLTFQKKLQTALFLAGIVDVDHPGLEAAIKARPQPHVFELLRV
jgi:hypothetical protein